MNDDREHQVRQRAYALWESEGRPEGRHDEHWHRANAGLGQDAPAAENAPQQQTAAVAETKPKPARRKPVAAGRAAAETPAAVEESSAAPRKRRAVKPKAG